VVQADPESRILYLNRCQGGCTFSPGYDDSRYDSSSIVRRTSFLAEYAPSAEAWDRIVDCVTAIYAPFDIEVTDVDPGETPHFEAVVAGSPGDIGMRNNVGGVAPFTCGVIENAVTFTFAGSLGSPQQICEVVGQESAHAFGLDHELLCQDPMTYLSGCGQKCFRDQDAECGEQNPRDCSCGGSTQNSYRRISDLFGPRTSEPELAIYDPAPQQVVPAGFSVRVRSLIPCMTEVTAVVEQGGQSYDAGKVTTWPYVLDAPDELAKGPATVTVTAVDVDGATFTDTVEVTVGDPPPTPPTPPAPTEPDAGAGPGAGGDYDNAGGGACAAGGGPAGLPPILLALLLAFRHRD
jgi:hypothetical protein